MHHKIASSRNGVIALTAIAVLSTFASAALAGNGHGRGNGRGHGRGAGYTVRYRQPQRVYVRRPTRVVYARPAYEACAPRYVTYRPQSVIIVRPAPYVRIGARIGSIDISAILGPRGHRSHYDYGCNFCSAHFTSYGSYESHVQGCDHRPENSRIECREWDNEGYDEYRGSRSDDRGYDDGGYRSDDRGYDDRDDRDRDDDGYYDN